MTTTITTASGRTKTLPSNLDQARVVGLDPEGRILVDDFGGDFYFGLTLCCQASDKGIEDGVVCRSCYSDTETGSYLFKDHGYPGLDPRV